MKVLVIGVIIMARWKGDKLKKLMVVVQEESAREIQLKENDKSIFPNEFDWLIFILGISVADDCVTWSNRGKMISMPC